MHSNAHAHPLWNLRAFPLSLDTRSSRRPRRRVRHETAQRTARRAQKPDFGKALVEPFTILTFSRFSYTICLDLCYASMLNLEAEVLFVHAVVRTPCQRSGGVPCRTECVRSVVEGCNSAPRDRLRQVACCRNVSLSYPLICGRRP